MLYDIKILLGGSIFDTEKSSVSVDEPNLNSLESQITRSANARIAYTYFW